MRYARLLLVGYALVLLVGCGSDEPKGITGAENMEVHPTAVPTVAPHIMKVYSHNGILLGAYTGKFRDCYQSGECYMDTAKGKIRVKGIIIVEPNTP